MSTWEDFKTFTKNLALSKPVRWTVSGVSGFTLGGTSLNLLLAFTPESFFALNIVISIILTISVARLTSRGYTALESQSVEITSLKKEFQQQKKIIEAQDLMIKQLVNDTKEQNQNNQSFYLQQMGIIRFCEALLANFPDEENERLQRLLDPPSLAELNDNKRPPTMLQSMIITPEYSYDSDSSEEEQEKKDVTINIPPAPVTVTTTQPSLMNSFYQGAQSLYGSTLSFWRVPKNEMQNELAFLQGLPQDPDSPRQSPV
jgi:hypothetical protein